MKLPHTNFFVTAVLLIAVGITGCTTIHYVEQETPPGQIPPPNQISAPTPVPSHDNDANPPSQDSTPTAPPEQESEDDAFAKNKAEILERFSVAYKVQGKPKIAFFLNRSLSSEVQEWRTESRAILTIRQKKIKREKDESSETDKTTEAALYTQTHNQIGGDRLNPNEIWMWLFEDGFLHPLLEGGTRVVDRAVIMRLQASSDDKQADPHAYLSVKKVEMDALIGHADLFMEILVARSNATPYGYEFKATAKEVKTGIILANVTSLKWRIEDFTRRRVVVTEKGYEIWTIFPLLDEISERLALDLMDSLAKRWEK